jgi:hypothetical protein
MPAAQTPEDNSDSALIGGIVGGALSLLLLVGALIAFCVMRNRRQDSTSTPLESNYGRIAPDQGNYRDAGSHYDVLNPTEL